MTWQCIAWISMNNILHTIRNAWGEMQWAISWTLMHRSHFMSKKRKSCVDAIWLWTIDPTLKEHTKTYKGYILISYVFKHSCIPNKRLHDDDMWYSFTNIGRFLSHSFVNVHALVERICMNRGDSYWTICMYVIISMVRVSFNTRIRCHMKIDSEYWFCLLT